MSLEEGTAIKERIHFEVQLPNSSLAVRVSFHRSQVCVTQKTIYMYILLLIKILLFVGVSQLGVLVGISCNLYRKEKGDIW